MWVPVAAGAPPELVRLLVALVELDVVRELGSSRNGNHSSLFLHLFNDELEDMDVSLNFQTRRKGPITFTLNISKTILAVT